VGASPNQPLLTGRRARTHHPGRPPLSTAELRSKATVCRVMEWEADTELTKDERAYLRFFVRKVEDYLNNSAEG
jgi:hypothetical protein